MCRRPDELHGAYPGNGLVAAGGGGLQGEHGRGGDHPHHARRAAGAGVADADIDALELSPVQLFHLGAEQAIHIYDQNGNGRLDAADNITFYAAAVPSDYRKYARYNVYWLADAGSASPLRMATVDGTPSGGALAASHLCTARHELDQTYLQSAVGADAMDRWIFSSIAMGAGFAGGGVAKDFTLSLPGALAAGDLTIRMYSPYELAHETSVSVNGSGVGSATWSGIGWTEAAFAGVSLLDGANTVSLSCTGSLDKTAADWFEVVYARNFAAVSDSLKFTHAGGYRYQVAGFTSADAELYDVTDPAAVVRVVNGSSSGSGPYTLEAEPAGASGARSYLAVASAGLKTPAAVVKDRASSLSAASNAADWILITHRSLGWDGAGAEQGWVTALAALRQGQGLRTKVVDIEDVFDEFGYGLVTPQAVKDFLTHAYESWQSPAPQYVLLVGDTSYDYKDNWGAGTVNLVPGYLIHTTHLGETITRRVVRPGQRRGRGSGSLYRPAAGGNSCPGAGDGRQDRGLRECLQLQELGADAGAVGGQPGRELGGGVRDDERGRGRAAARGYGDARAVLPAGVREREPRGDGPDRGAAVCGGGRGAGGELRGPRQREPLGDRAGPGQPGRGVPVGRLDA